MDIYVYYSMRQAVLRSNINLNLTTIIRKKKRWDFNYTLQKQNNFLKIYTKRNEWLNNTKLQNVMSLYKIKI